MQWSVCVCVCVCVCDRVGSLCCQWRQGKRCIHTQTLNVEPPKLISQTCDFQFQTRDTNPALNIHAESSEGLLAVPHCRRAAGCVVGEGMRRVRRVGGLGWLPFNQLS